MTVILRLLHQSGGYSVDNNLCLDQHFTPQVAVIYAHIVVGRPERAILNDI